MKVPQSKFVQAQFSIHPFRSQAVAFQDPPGTTHVGISSKKSEYLLW